MNFDWFNKKNIFYKISISILFAFFILTTTLIYFYREYTNEITRTTKADTDEQAKITAEILDNSFSNVIKIADSIANELSNGTLKNENIKKRLEKQIDYKNKLCGVGVAFIPNTNDENLRVSSPYYASRVGIDKTDKEELITVYSTPIFRIDSLSKIKIVTGNVYIDFLATDIKDMMSTLKKEGKEDDAKSGYGFLLSPNGTYIVHPTSEYNMNEENSNAKTIFEVATELDDNKLKELGELAVIGAESGMFEHPNEQTGQDSWMFYQPIPSISWSLISVYITDDMPIARNILRNFLISISISFVVFLIALYTIVTKAYMGNVSKMVLVSVFASILLFSEIAFVWYLTLEYDVLEDKNAIKIVDKTGLDKQKNLYNRKVKAVCNTTPIYIPTGIFIEAMEFPTASNVFLSGILWQKYDDEAQKYLEENDKGVIFPEAIKDVITLTSEHEEDNHVVYQWFFQITLKKSFDFSKYPLDKKDLLIRILPKDFEKNIVLTPSLEDYRNINPIKLPGIQKGLIVENWNLKASNFVYKFNDYNTNFGIKKFECKKDAPELFFDVNLTRNFVGAIISSLLPMLVMLSVLYILITIATRNIDMVARVLGPMGSFFFAILLAHVSLRRDLVVENMVYFEYVYIVMYFMILLIFINTVLYSRETDRFFFHYKKNLITKLLFWPVFNILLLLLTLYLLVLK